MSSIDKFQQYVEDVHKAFEKEWDDPQCPVNFKGAEIEDVACWAFCAGAEWISNRNSQENKEAKISTSSNIERDEICLRCKGAHLIECSESITYYNCPECGRKLSPVS